MSDFNHFMKLNISLENFEDFQTLNDNIDLT
jgi:hypothetical protein